MSDADMIYNALLRAERRLEDGANAGRPAPYAALLAPQTLREEIGNALSKEGR